MAKATGQITIVDYTDGIQAILTNENHTLTADSSGTVLSYDGAVTQMIIYEGTEDATSSYTITKSENGISGALVGNTYTVTSVTNGVGGTATFTATKDDITIQKTFALSLSKQGPHGDGAYVNIYASSNVFRREDGTVLPDYIYLTPQIANVTYVKWQYSLDGTTWIDLVEVPGELDIITGDEPNTLRISNICSLIQDNKAVTFKYVSSNVDIYDQVTILFLDELDVDVQDLVTETELNDNTNKVYITKPSPPYRTGDVWMVQDPNDPDYGKIKTCVITRTEGNYNEEDWITPLTAYTEVSEFTEITGISPEEWEQGRKSIIKLINENTGNVEAVYGELGKLSVRSSNIEMSFSKTGTSNFMPNSSGQYGTRLWTSDSPSSNFTVVTSSDASDVRRMLISGYAFNINIQDWNGLSDYSVESGYFIPPIGQDFSVSMKIKNTSKYSKVHVEINAYDNYDGTTATLLEKIGEFDSYYSGGNDFILTYILGLVAPSETERIKCKITISPTDTVQESELPNMYEQNSNGSYKYLGKIVEVGNDYYYCKSDYSKINIITGDDPTHITNGEVWKCTQSTYDENTNEVIYVSGTYYRVINGNIVPITDSYIISQLDDDNYYAQIPTEWEQQLSFEITPSPIYIGDIMFNGGRKIMIWTPRQDEVLYGSRIKFSSQGIEIQDNQTGYKRELNEQADIAWQLDNYGNIVACIWKLSPRGMLVNDIQCYGVFSMGTVNNTINPDTFTSVLDMKRTTNNDGIDEYIYM